MSHQVTRTENTLTLRRPAVEVLKGYIAFFILFLPWIIGPIILEGMGIPSLFEIRLFDLIEGGLVVMDRKKNALYVDGRWRCSLDKVTLKVRHRRPPMWLPARFHNRRRRLILRFPSSLKFFYLQSVKFDDIMLKPIGEFSGASALVSPSTLAEQIADMLPGCDGAALKVANG